MSSKVAMHLLTYKLFYYQLFSSYFLFTLQLVLCLFFKDCEWDLLFMSFISGNEEDVTKFIQGDMRFDRINSKTGVWGLPAAKTSVMFMKNLGS